MAVAYEYDSPALTIDSVMLGVGWPQALMAMPSRGPMRPL